jgi:heparin lyase
LTFVAAVGQASVEPLPFRNSAQRDIVPPENIVDGLWCIVGTREQGGGQVLRDTDHPYEGQPVYHFSAASHSVKRVEFSQMFGSVKNLAGLSAGTVSNAVAFGCAYLNAEEGQYGDTVTYEWATRFPKPLGPDSRAIFAQWHGRPDCTLVSDGKTVRHLSPVEFAALLKTVKFDETGWGSDHQTGQRVNLRLDGGAGGPIGAFLIGDNHMFLIIRSDASRLSTSDERQKPNPSQEIGHHIQAGAKEASLVWKLPLSQVPINQWIAFKVRIQYSEYAANDDKVVTPGAVTLWINGSQVADWKGNVGKNDLLGPYFKFGIYGAGEGGFQVDHAGCKRTIERTRTSPLVSHPLKQ